MKIQVRLLVAAVMVLACSGCVPYYYNDPYYQPYGYYPLQGASRVLRAGALCWLWLLSWLLSAPPRQVVICDRNVDRSMRIALTGICLHATQCRYCPRGTFRIESRLPASLDRYARSVPSHPLFFERLC